MRPTRSACALAALALAAGCDLTPTLDIPLPDHEPGVAVHSVLVSGRPPVVWLTVTRDPFVERSGDAAEQRALVQATVELTRADGSVERLRGESYGGVGRFYGATPIDVNATYALRVQVAGLPEATATVTVPLPATVEAEAAPSRDHVSFRIHDPAGEHRYAIELGPVGRDIESSRPIRQPDGTFRDSTFLWFVNMETDGFSTSDPLLLASAGEPGDANLDVAVFSDATFDSAARSFTIRPRLPPFSSDALRARRGTLYVATLDEKTYHVHQMTTLSLGDDNPFEEPSNLPSNVAGGYGLVGAATVHPHSFRFEDPR